LTRRPFAKPALDLESLAILLASRGLVFENWADAIHHLQHIGYYRFTGYLRPFKIGGAGDDKENFRPNTTFEIAHDRYIFDRKLRILVLEAVEKIEIAVRSAISNSVATKHGPHWFLERRLFAQPTWYKPRVFDIRQWYSDFLSGIKKQIGHIEEGRRSVFIKHYYETYSRPELPPSWMIFEAISFGSVSQCLKFLKYPEHLEICNAFGVNHQTLSSWLHAISYVRNVCAHHGRLWNHILTIKPLIPNNRRGEFPTNERVYAALLAMQFILQSFWSNNHWAERLRDLLNEHPNIPLDAMGFPGNWTQRRVWAL
jgi:abortive infection bacteriophage resistance protein